MANPFELFHNKKVYMNTNSILTRSDYLKFLQYLNNSDSQDEDFLILNYFGANKDYIYSGINRAYRDFSRTLHGFGQNPNKDITRTKASQTLKRSLLDLQQSAEEVDNQPSFDIWHKKTCLGLVDIFKKTGFHFYIGQAQKWVNMSFKYIYTIGESRVPCFGTVYQFCHVPLDNILISQFMKYGFPSVDCAWSRIDIYGEYLYLQKWIRDRFSQSPLDVEFNLWLDESRRLSYL